MRATSAAVVLDDLIAGDVVVDTSGPIRGTIRRSHAVDLRGASVDVRLGAEVRTGTIRSTAGDVATALDELGDWALTAHPGRRGHAHVAGARDTSGEQLSLLSAHDVRVTRVPE